MGNSSNSHRRPLVWYMAEGYSIRGGHEAHILHYATELRHHGFDTKVIVPRALPRESHLFMKLLSERGIALESLGDAIRYRSRAAFAVGLAPWRFRQRLRRADADASRFREFVSASFVRRALLGKLAVDRPEIIHIFGRLRDDFWGLLPAEKCAFHHATEGRRDASWSEKEAAAFTNFAGRCARNFAPGSGVAANVRREFGIGREIMPVFTICPDQAQFSTAGQPNNHANERRFGILCRMIREKGLEHILDALRVYRDKHGSVSFLFAGAGPLQGRIEAYIKEHRMQGVTQQRDFQSPVDVLRKLEVFVHPSVSDAMPMAVAEALMCGLPCIVSRVGGLPDLVRDGVEGFVVEPGDSEQIVATMERFSMMPVKERLNFRERARARYEEVCRPDRVASIVSDHYRQIIQKNTACSI